MIPRIRILGIDPGSRQTGFGVVDFAGDTPEYVASGTIRSRDGAFSDRLKSIFSSVGEIVAAHRPDAVAIESVFMARNAGSALKLGHARSAAMCATFAYDVDVFEYAPREIKLAIVGTGSATKEQVQHMVAVPPGRKGSAVVQVAPRTSAETGAASTATETATKSARYTRSS